MKTANEDIWKDSGYRRNLRENSHSGQDLIVEWIRMVKYVVLEKIGGMRMDSLQNVR